MARKNTMYDVFSMIDMRGGEDACWPWLGGTGGGTAKSKPRPYFQVNGRKWIAYRLVWTLIEGQEPQASEFLCHSCDNSICCNHKHLSIGSHEKNMEEMVERDRHGMPHDTVKQVRLLLMIGKMTHAEIAGVMNTSAATVGRIHRNELHTHVNDYPDAPT